MRKLRLRENNHIVQGKSRVKINKTNLCCAKAIVILLLANILPLFLMSSSQGLIILKILT